MLSHVRPPCAKLIHRRSGHLAGVLALASMFGCQSLPLISPDPTLPGVSPPVQLAGPRGPLSPAESRAVLAQLARRNQPSNIFERHLAVEEALAGSPLTIGNRVLLLQDGPATYRAMFAAIEAAQDHINLETYILDDDEVGQRFAQLLIAKQRAGIQVNLLYDSVGTLNTPQAFFQSLADSGIALKAFNPVNPLQAGRRWTLNQRDHRKLLIVDGRTAFLGGINISSVYAGGSFRQGAQRHPTTTPAWRDTDLQLQGPAVAELQKLFMVAWASQAGPPLAQRHYFPTTSAAGQQVVRIIGSSPEEAFSQIYATLLSAIASAETSVHLTNAYFVPDSQLLAALEAAAARGVRVVLILPSQTDSWLAFHAGRGYYERLLRAGVAIYERHDVILHAKTVLIDGVWATVGSTNLDWRSFLHNHELDAVILGTNFAQQLQAMFARDLAGSRAIALRSWVRRPPWVKAQEWFARRWAYWL